MKGYMSLILEIVGTTVGFVILLVIGVTNLEEMANWIRVGWEKCTNWAKPRQEETGQNPQGAERQDTIVNGGQPVGGIQNSPTGGQGLQENHTPPVAGIGDGQNANQTARKTWLGRLIERWRGQGHPVNENPA
ncbi:hypothetical protein M434DRAFT_262279 [Hypoxylon sp. CO27-5]|nr:hypothetical protein M434DRAFT_262279 [Hypoxylon sp. CO27-5]